VSIGLPDRIFITPSGVRYPELAPSEIVEIPRAGPIETRLRPSSEWRFHRDVYAARPEVGAIVHTHQPHATAVACLRRDVPAVHYMIAAAGGPTIRCAPYATFGTQQLSDHVVAALRDRTACLIANHGLVALGETPEAAMELAVSIEALCHIYLLAAGAGDPVSLTEAEMHDVLERFGDYGPRSPSRG
jgi:L-fuculose-phosphate aldolase